MDLSLGSLVRHLDLFLVGHSGVWRQLLARQWAAVAGQDSRSALGVHMDPAEMEDLVAAVDLAEVLVVVVASGAAEGPAPEGSAAVGDLVRPVLAQS